MKTAEIEIDEDFSGKSPLAQLAMASLTVEEVIRDGILSRIVVEGLEEIHKLQAYLNLYCFASTDLDTYTKLESRVYMRRYPDCKFAQLTVSRMCGVFGELKILNEAP